MSSARQFLQLQNNRPSQGILLTGRVYRIANEQNEAHMQLRRVVQNGLVDDRVNLLAGDASLDDVAPTAAD
jgi:hypothetical protein